MLALFGATAVSGQFITEGFETMPMDSGTVLNGSKGERDILLHPKGPFVSKIPVLWDTSFGGYWAAGWAVSRKLDGSGGASDFRNIYTVPSQVMVLKKTCRVNTMERPMPLG